jgi:hypothetical protein
MERLRLLHFFSVLVSGGSEVSQMSRTRNSRLKRIREESLSSIPGYAERSHNERVLLNKVLQSLSHTEQGRHLQNLLNAIREFSDYWSLGSAELTSERISGFETELTVHIVSTMLHVPERGTLHHAAWINHVIASKLVLQKYTDSMLMTVLKIPRERSEPEVKKKLRRVRHPALESWKWLQQNYDRCVDFRGLVESYLSVEDSDVYLISEGELTEDE